MRPAQTAPPPDAIIIERVPRPALPPSYNNSVRTKVNASNLISVLVIFNGVVMHAKAGHKRFYGWGSRSGEELVVIGGGELGQKQN